MSSKRTYRKVRGACLTCKGRKVRCGLEQPICRNCSRLSRECVYAVLEPQPSSKCENCQSKPIDEIELMHYYTAYTYSTISDNPILTSLWKKAVPKHAFQHRFLLHGLFAITAQHKLQNNKDSSPDLISAANFYQQEALSGFIGLLNNITEENCHALFAFSQVVVGISCSRLSLDLKNERKSSHEVIASIAGIFELLKGALAIASEASEWLRAGDLGWMMDNIPQVQPLENSETDAHNVCIKALSALSDYISASADSSVESQNRVETLQSTIQLLYTIFLENFEEVDRLNKVAGLPIFFDVNYVRLLKERDHAALVLLSYYGVALYRLSHAWFFDGVGARIVEAAAELVGPDLTLYMICARQVTGQIKFQRRGPLYPSLRNPGRLGSGSYCKHG